MAKRQSKVLSTEIVWMPSEDDLKELKQRNDENSSKALLTCKRVGSLRKAVSIALHYAEVSFLDLRVKKGISFDYVESSDEDSYDVKKRASLLTYSEVLYSINCEIKTEKDLSSYLRNIVNLFCSCKIGNGLKDEVWMSFDITELFDEEIKPISPTTELKCFALGNLVGLNTFVEHFDSTSTLNEHGYKITQIKCRFLHDFQRLELYFVVGRAKLQVKKRSSETHRLFKLEIPYVSLHRILVCNEKKLVVFLYFLHPPLLYGVVEKPEAEMYTSLLNCSPETNWERILDLFEGSPLELRREFSMNTVLKLEFDSQNDYDCLIQLMHHCSHIELYFSPVATLAASKSAQIYAISCKSFDCYYAVKCITSRSFEVYDHITALGNVKEVNNFLAEKCKENPILLSEVLFQIYSSLDQGNVVIFSRALKALFRNRILESTRYDHFITSQSAINQNSQNMPMLNEFEHVKSEIILIRRAVVTPTHVRFILKQPMLKSRLLRSCNAGYALRASVRDVNLNGLSFTVRAASGSGQRELQVKFVTEHIKQQMLKGIKIGNRLYEYLGGSTSQLRSQGLWFYAKDDKNRTATHIRSTVGDLNDIYLVPKYMARMGQSFSQAMGFITVPQGWTNVKCPENDILGEKKVYAPDFNKTDEKDVEEYKKYLDATFKGEKCDSEVPGVPDSERYNFTDGIGRVSQEIADLVYEELELQEEVPSAMQIRYAGCKGMLVVDPQMEGKEIVFRKSMKKYDSGSESLEILKTSSPRAVYLNRPFITILEQMGIEKTVFLKLQKQEIQALIKSIFYNNYAEDVLKTRCQLQINYTGLLFSGFSLTEDPFFRSMILAIFKREIELLKTKARILIDLEKGRTMFGVVDETSSLEYGEVFVQYTHSVTRDPKKTTILQGRVLVTKNPSSHPGDVRIFRAVHVKKLEHIRDCIVFPAKGPRPHPDEMAGSDLDGDEYCVIWDTDVMFARDNYPAMHFAFPSETDEHPDKPVEISDELDFFCKYIMNSSVGVLANAWLAWADKHKSGIFSEKCCSIAKKYSIALDFAKNGRVVTLGRGERVFTYPDFMQKLSEKDTYASEKALGCLYRNCRRLELGFELTTVETKFPLDRDLIYESWEKYKVSALSTLRSYYNRIFHSLKVYGIDNEGELVSGALRKVSKLYEDRHDFSDLTNILEFEVKKLFQNLQKEFFAEFGGKPEQNEFTEDMRRKASAWYIVTYSQDNCSKETKCFGLPWAVTDVLIDIKNRKSSKTEEEQASNFGSILTKKASFIETLIDESLKNRMAPLTTSNFRLVVLDTAHGILTRWLKLQEKNLKVVDLKLLKKCLVEIFDEISTELYSCDDQHVEYLLKSGEKRKISSPAYYILETLMRIAELGTSGKESNNFDAYQEFGLFAWVTLLKLGCFASIEPLGITETAEDIPQYSYLTHKDEVDTINIPWSPSTKLPDQSEICRMFQYDVIHEEEKVKAFIRKETELKSIEMRVVEEKGKQYSLRLTVKGSRFAIERLKDLVVLPNFFESVVSYKLEKKSTVASDKLLEETTVVSGKLVEESTVVSDNLVEKKISLNNSGSQINKRSRRRRKEKMQLQ